MPYMWHCLRWPRHCPEGESSCAPHAEPVCTRRVEGNRCLLVAQQQLEVRISARAAGDCTSLLT